MITENMIKTFGEGLVGNLLLILTNLTLETYNQIFTMACHGLVTFGTLFLMYKQYKKQNKK